MPNAGIARIAICAPEELAVAPNADDNATTDFMAAAIVFYCPQYA
jgi:hypothetical protein